MTPTALSLLLGLLLVHLAGDFLLQPGHWVAERLQLKGRSPRLYLHALIHGALAAGVLSLASLSSEATHGPIAIVGGSALIAFSHALIDLAKAQLSPSRLRWFLIDQALHLVAIVVLWLAWIGTWEPVENLSQWLAEPRTLGVATTYLIVTRPMAFAIAMLMRRWSEGLDDTGTLIKAGARIGMLERLLVLTLVLHDQITAVGFLITAKTVLRYGDLRKAQDRKLTEYVLLGTLLSVASTLILGLATRTILAMG